MFGKGRWFRNGKEVPASDIKDLQDNFVIVVRQKEIELLDAQIEYYKTAIEKMKQEMEIATNAQYN